MSDSPRPPVGSVGWFDLTVPDAVKIRDFYAAVTGWTWSPVEMDGYEDFCLNQPGDGATVAGVCHARGENADLPPTWLLYVTVADLDTSLREVAARGGTVVRPARALGGARMAVIRDPAGAVLALYEPASEPAAASG